MIAVARREFLAIRRTGVYTRWALLVTLPLLCEDERVVTMVMLYEVKKQVWAYMLLERFYWSKSILSTTNSKRQAKKCLFKYEREMALYVLHWSLSCAPDACTPTSAVVSPWDTVSSLFSVGVTALLWISNSKGCVYWLCIAQSEKIMEDTHHQHYQ